MNKLKFRRIKVLPAAVFMMIMLCMPLFASAQSDFTAYIPNEAAEGVVSQWEGKALSLTSTRQPQECLQRALQFKDGSWWGLKLKRENNADVSTWGSPGYSYNEYNESVEILLPDSQSQWPNFYYHPANPIKAADVKYIVIGLYSSKDMDLCMYPTNEAADEYIIGNTGRVVAIPVRKGYHEYVMNVADTNSCLNWMNSDMAEYDYFRFYDIAGQSEKPATLIFSYIRFVNDAYTGAIKNTDQNGTKVDNNTVEYDTENNVLDFVFPYELDMDSISWTTVTINKMPVKKITTAHAVNNRFRVELGVLENNTEYTVDFRNIKKADGTVMNTSFSFTTVQTERSDREAYLPYSLYTEISRQWDGADAAVTTDDYSEYKQRCISFDDGSWWGWQTLNDGDVSDWASALYRYDPNSKTMNIKLPKDQQHWPHFYYRLPAELKASEVSDVVAGIYSSKDMELYMYPTDEAMDEYVQGNSDRVVVFKLKAGYHEYVIHLNDSTCVKGWNDGGEYSYFHFYDTNGINETGAELKFSYLRFVKDEYKGFLSQTDYRGKYIVNGTKNYNPENMIMDFVFLDNPDVSAVTQQSVTVNGKPAEWVMTDQTNTGRIRVQLGNLQSGMKYTVKFPGIKKADGTQEDDFVFRTAGDSDIEDKVSLKLVTGYGTSDCTEVTETTEIAGKTVTAVCSGLRGGDEAKTYRTIIALYKDNVLQDIRFCEVSPESGSAAEEQSVGIDVPNDGNRYSIKAFVWEKASQISVCDAVQK